MTYLFIFLLPKRKTGTFVPAFRFDSQKVDLLGDGRGSSDPPASSLGTVPRSFELLWWRHWVRMFQILAGGHTCGNGLLTSWVWGAAPLHRSVKIYVSRQFNPQNVFIMGWNLYQLNQKSVEIFISCLKFECYQKEQSDKELKANKWKKMFMHYIVSREECHTFSQTKDKIILNRKYSINICFFVP